LPGQKYLKTTTFVVAKSITIIMWQEIIIGILVVVALWYISRRIYRITMKGDHGACADCPPGELKSTAQK